jgi:hypothetical protein
MGFVLPLRASTTLVANLRHEVRLVEYLPVSITREEMQHLTPQERTNENHPVTPAVLPFNRNISPFG